MAKTLNYDLYVEALLSGPNVKSLQCGRKKIKRFQIIFDNYYDGGGLIDEFDTIREAVCFCVARSIGMDYKYVEYTIIDTKTGSICTWKKWLDFVNNRYEQLNKKIVAKHLASMSPEQIKKAKEYHDSWVKAIMLGKK